MQKNYKENHLKPYAVRSINSKGRIYKESENSIRSPYQRDRDRIIHSHHSGDLNTKPKFL